MFFAQADRYGDRPLLWSKQRGRYRPLSWREVADAVCRLAQGLNSLGLQHGDRILIVAENRPEWVIADLAIMAIGAISVPAYTTNTESDHLYLLSNSGARGVIVSTSKLARPLLAAAARATDVAVAICIDPPEHPHQTASRLVAWQDLMSVDGDPLAIRRSADALSADDLACLIYTSGTGGAPKGAMLHHGAILHNCAGAAHAIRGIDDDPAAHVFLSFLPLSHAYEHTVGLFLPIAIGAQVYYAEGVERVLANMEEVRPTVISAVPRFYELIHQRITQQARKVTGLRARLFTAAVALGRRRYESPDGLPLAHRLADGVLDRLVRRRIRERFGGRIKVMVSGGAPLNIEIGLFLRALGLPLVQGYGQTEAAPLISVNDPQRVKLHTVGPPLLGAEVRIADDGEILVRGGMVMKGYWGNEAATREVLSEGWLHTGDVGAIDADGDIRITDRKKDIIVNSGGDNLSPARIEGLLALRPEIAQVFVHGDRRPHIVALIVPDAAWAESWAAANNAPAALPDLVEDARFTRAVADAVEQVNAQLSTIERVRRFLITADAFSVDNAQLTPTLKLRRHAIRTVYGLMLDHLYEPGAASGAVTQLPQRATP
jgi:Long-chain acyl-CoA synthetases (AMP-forming)